jgi:hypothetical protein
VENQYTEPERVSGVRIASKIVRWVGIPIGVLALIVVGIVMKVDPPPLRLRDVEKAALSVSPAPKLDGLQHTIENGLTCKHKLQSYTSSVYGRPQITFFDWLRHSRGEPAEPDVHLLAGKPDETWTVKVDRAAGAICYQQPGYARAGLTEAYCGPKIVHENANQLIAIEDRAFDIVRAIYFDKKKYTLMMTELDESNNTGASIQYFECY